MAIVEMELPTKEKEANQRMKALKDDIRRIIFRKVKYCEIVDAPYSENSLRQHLNKAIRIVCWETKYKNAETDKLPNADLTGMEKSFNITSKKIDGKRHFYVTFSPEAWQRAMIGERE